MDDRLFEFSHRKRAPVFNQDVVKGIACKDVPGAQRYVDSIIRCGEKQYPEGFVYEGSERCNPLEEYNVITRARAGNNRIYDIARSSVFLVKYNFSLHGKPLHPMYMYLPFVHQAGMLYISGKQFAIAPVMGDRAFEIDENSVFIRIPRAPISFNRESHTIVIDGVREKADVVYSQLHNKGGKKSRNRSDLIRLGHVQSSLAHYLFCKYGMYGAFEKYCGTRPIIMKKEDYDEAKFPSDHWVVVSSHGKEPDGLHPRRKPGYHNIATQLIMLVDRGAWTEMTRSFAAGFFYVIDHFPEFVTEPSELEETWWWCVFMAFIQWGEGNNYGRLVEDVETHLKSLDSYVDQETVKTLQEVQVNCKDLYDLMAYIMREMRTMLENNRGKEASLYNKRLEVLRYLLRNINNSMFEFLFKITGNSKKVLQPKEYEDILRKYFNPWLIHGISSAAEHPEVSSVSNPSDNMFFKVTSVIVQQTDTHGRGKSQDAKPIGPTMYLDSSFAEITGFGVLPKSTPIGNNRFNPCVKLDPETRTTVPSPEHQPVLDGVQRLIQRV
ncbi:hypothetical protein D3C85_456150 [compost metagenome]